MQEKMERSKKAEEAKEILIKNANFLTDSERDALIQFLARSGNKKPSALLSTRDHDFYSDRIKVLEEAFTSMENQKRGSEKLYQEIKNELNITQANLNKEHRASAAQQANINELENMLSTAHSEHTRISGLLKESTEEAKNTRGLLEAAKKQYDELKMLGDAADFWLQKSNGHRAGFTIGMAVFISLVGTSIWALISYWDPLSNLLPKSNGEVSLAGVGVLFLFALGPVWVLRIIARFVNENFSLWHDGLARNTMMKTYLALVGNPNAQIRPQDRTLILSAVFRPPANNSSDALPTSFIEAATQVVEKAKV